MIRPPQRHRGLRRPPPTHLTRGLPQLPTCSCSQLARERGNHEDSGPTTMVPPVVRRAHSRGQIQPALGSRSSPRFCPNTHGARAQLQSNAGSLSWAAGKGALTLDLGHAESPSAMSRRRWRGVAARCAPRPPPGLAPDDLKTTQVTLIASSSLTGTRSGCLPLVRHIRLLGHRGQLCFDRPRKPSPLPPSSTTTAGPRRRFLIAGSSAERASDRGGVRTVRATHPDPEPQPVTVVPMRTDCPIGRHMSDVIPRLTEPPGDVQPCRRRRALEAAVSTR